MAAARANWRHETEVFRQGFRAVAGLDEAGCGPLAGPVVAAAVIVQRRRFRVRIDDSKRLTALQRERAYAVICERAHVGVGIASHDVIERVNIFQAARAAMQDALGALPHAPDFLLVDGRQPPLSDVPQRSIIHGDRLSISIACASIVAKVTRDRLMRFYDRLFPAYRFAQHKGYGTRTHLQALREHGPSPLHRRTFAPVAELLP